MQIASEYMQILKKLNISYQVILVGHGAGGYNMRFVTNISAFDLRTSFIHSHA